jgi:hypothetical protein
MSWLMLSSTARPAAVWLADSWLMIASLVCLAQKVVLEQ